MSKLNDTTTLRQNPWFGEYGIFITPSPVYSGMKRLSGHANSLGPNGQRESLAMTSKEYNRSRIPVLFCFCGPSTVLRTIWAVIVDSVNGVCGPWCFPHVAEKVSKGHPSLANGYTPTPIVRKCLVGLIQTTVSHVHPGVEFLGCLAALVVARSAMCCSPSRSFFNTKATAGFSHPGNKSAGFNKRNLTTYAQALPRYSIFIGESWTLFNYRESGKYLACMVNKLLHFFTLKCVTMMDAWQIVVNNFSGATLAKQANYIKQLEKGQ